MYVWVLRTVTDLCWAVIVFWCAYFLYHSLNRLLKEYLKLCWVEELFYCPLQSNLMWHLPTRMWDDPGTCRRLTTGFWYPPSALCIPSLHRRASLSATWTLSKAVTRLSYSIYSLFFLLSASRHFIVELRPSRRRAPSPCSLRSLYFHHSSLQFGVFLMLVLPACLALVLLVPTLTLEFFAML